MVINNIENLIISGKDIRLRKLKTNTVYFCISRAFTLGKEIIGINYEESNHSRFLVTPAISSSHVFDYVFFNFRPRNKKWIASYHKTKNIIIINGINSTTLKFKKWALKTIIRALNKRGNDVSLQNTGKFIFPVTYGVDMEFEAIKNLKPAMSYASSKHDISSNRYYLGCIKSSQSAQIGLDFSSGPVELRPTQGLDEEELTNNFKRLFVTLKNDKLRNRHNFSVIGDKHAIGGHIHFGVGGRYEPTKRLLELLDFYIGRKLLTLSGKARENYKRCSNKESKSYGFEYRTPPASYCENPKIFKLVIKIARLVFTKYSENTIKKNRGLCVATKNDYIGLGLNKKEVDYLNKWKKEYIKTKSYKTNIINNWA